MPEKYEPARKFIPSTQKEFCDFYGVRPATFKKWLIKSGFDFSKISGIRRYPPPVAQEIYDLYGNGRRLLKDD